MSNSDLFSPVEFGDIKAANRIIMAPLTRGRASAEHVPTEIMPTYYAQRASAGLIVSEATFISPQGVGFMNAPGIFSEKQKEAWKPVTSAVHDKGGKIVLQLWHMGRASHSAFHDGELAVAPSAIAIDGEIRTPAGKKTHERPRELRAEELPGIVDDYAKAASRAIAAGFDGVEIHGANGYLLDEFIRDGSNQRGDEFGGSIENRWRFPLQVVDAVVAEVGAGRTGIRFSPTGSYNSMSDSAPLKSYSYGLGEIEKKGLAFVHLIEAIGGMMYNGTAPILRHELRKILSSTPLILNGGYDLAHAKEVVAEGGTDAVAFGVPFIANPDLVERYKAGHTGFNTPDFSTFYTPGEKGYLDYPTMS